jgi:hypothetical protein
MPLAVVDYTDPYMIVQIAVGTLTFLIVMSYVFEDNAAYKMLTHILLGCATAVTIMILYKNVLRPNWVEPVRQGVGNLAKGKWDPKLFWLLCLVPGAMWYTLYSKKRAWMSRLVFAMFIGMGAGLAFKKYLLLIVPQVTKSFRPLIALAPGGGLDWGTTIHNTLFTAALVSVLVYFFFTFRSESPLLRRTRAWGRWMMMICFGTLFGFTVMTRMSYLLERLRYIKIELIQGIFGL